MPPKRDNIAGTGPVSALAGHPVLVLDCQATGPNPKRDRLLELGWAITSGASGRLHSPETHLMRLARGVPLPRTVTRMTGLCIRDLQRGLTPRRAWKRLLAAKQHVPAPCRAGLPPLVIHFARYERPFLQYMHGICNGKAPFPFEIICTHGIARRLFPGLPRMGLRALAGHLNFPLPETRRCRTHLTATAHIWRHLCESLAARGVATFPDLAAWLRRPVDREPAPRRYPMPRGSRADLPRSPGIYRFLDSSGRTLYVGKAKSLGQRVGSYFQARRRHPEHILEMLTQARDIQTRPTASALESALLECDEISRLAPPYNIALRRTGRNLRRWTRELVPWQDAAADRRILGYFPGTAPLDGLRFIFNAMQPAFNRNRPPATITGMPGIDPKAAPTPELLAGSLAWLRRRFPQLANARGLGSFLAVGTFWEWQQRLQSGEDASGEERHNAHAPDAPATSHEQEQREKREKREKREGREKQRHLEDRMSPDTTEWTAQSLGRTFLQCLAHSARLIRRAHWFTLISEVSFAWQQAQDREYRQLTFDRGRPRPAHAIHRLQDLQLPPAWRRPHQERLLGLGAGDITRLRVFTTEIKRLTACQRPMLLCVGPNRIFDRNDLARITAWL